MPTDRRTCSIILSILLTVCGWPTGSEGRDPSAEDPLQQGVVVGPDDRPIAGAKVYWFARGMAEPTPDKPAATTDADGKFEIHAALPKSGELDDADADRFFGWESPGLMATAEGFGIGFAPAHPKGKNKVVLVKDDVPMTGRLLDPNGRPVVGARVWGMRVLIASPKRAFEEQVWPRTGAGPYSLDPWIDALKAAQDRHVLHDATQMISSIPPSRYDIFDGVHPPAITGDDGRFRIDGIGRDRVLMAFIEGPGIESRVVFLATKADVKPGPDPIWRQQRRPFDLPGTKDVVYGPGFDHVVLPGRAIEGTVRDKDTGRPMPGVSVASGLQTDMERAYFPSGDPFASLDLDAGFLWDTTDDDGHYKIEGFPVGPTYSIKARTEPDIPYPKVTREAQVGLGQGPTTLDFTLKRGVWLTGRVLDRATGQPQRNAYVRVYLEPSNPNILQEPDGVSFKEERTDEEGRFRIVTLPGPGLITAWGSEDFLTGIGVDRVKAKKDRDWLLTYPDPLVPEHVSTIVPVDPPSGSDPIAVDLLLDRGGSRLVKVVGPDGQPEADLRVSVAVSVKAPDEDVPPPRRPDGGIEGSEFTVNGLGPKGRAIVIRQDAEERIARVVVLEGDRSPLAVKLEPWASVAGRVLEEAGQPREGIVELEWDLPDRPFAIDLGRISFGHRLDAGGRFLIKGLVPGIAYRLRTGRDIATDPIATDLTLKPGEARDLGDVRVKKGP